MHIINAIASNHLGGVVNVPLHVALLWSLGEPPHDEKICTDVEAGASLWARRHAMRNYYMLAMMLDDFPNLRITVCFTTEILSTLVNLSRSEPRDELWRLVQKPADSLTVTERQRLTAYLKHLDFFGQVIPSQRLSELYIKWRNGAELSEDELTDLQAWLELAWFHPRFLNEDIALPDGTLLSMRNIATRESGFSHDDVLAICDAERKVLRNLLPLYVSFYNRGRLDIGVTATPAMVSAISTKYDPVAFECTFGARPQGLYVPEEVDPEPFYEWLKVDSWLWIVTDREVGLLTDERIEHPSEWYQPYALQWDNCSATLFFRDDWVSRTVEEFAAFDDSNRESADEVIALVRDARQWA
ncbi:MAG TPA: hypothetical protein EYP10_04610, partial [Armatimonadetes bacterium]|nr:hypothetical protein [Armatimonadota bacterium]